MPLRVGRAERSASRACGGLVPWRLRSNRRTGPDCSMVASPTATRPFLRGRERRLHGRQREKCCGRAGGSACSRCGAPSHARPTPRGAPPSQAPATMLQKTPRAARSVPTACKGGALDSSHFSGSHAVHTHGVRQASAGHATVFLSSVSVCLPQWVVVARVCVRSSHVHLFLFLQNLRRQYGRSVPQAVRTPAPYSSEGVSGGPHPQERAPSAHLQDTSGSHTNGRARRRRCVTCLPFVSDQRSWCFSTRPRMASRRTRTSARVSEVSLFVKCWGGRRRGCLPAKKRRRCTTDGGSLRCTVFSRFRGGRKGYRCCSTCRPPEEPCFARPPSLSYGIHGLATSSPSSRARRRLPRNLGKNTCPGPAVPLLPRRTTSP